MGVGSGHKGLKWTARAPGARKEGQPLLLLGSSGCQGSDSGMGGGGSGGDWGSRGVIWDEGGNVGVGAI